MTIEEELFENAHYDETKLLKYGFVKKDANFYYETTIYNGEFAVLITITKDEKVFGKMIERCSNEEFFNFRLQNVEGTFVNQVREEYIKLLTDIKEQCFRFTIKRNYWVVPANTKRYDVIGHFKKYETITWRQTTDVEVHDIVYIYIGSPISSIMFKCEAIKVNFVGEHANTMELKLLETYKEGIYSLKLLREFDLRAIRGARKMPQKAVNLLNSISIF